MAFLTIAGTDYDVIVSGATEEPDVQGESFRSFSGRHRTIRTGIDKRNWNFTLGPLTQAMVNTLEAAIALGAVTVTGSALELASITCYVEIIRKTYTDGNFGGSDFYYVIPIRIFEQ